MAVHRQDVRPFDADEVLGIAIGTPQGPQQRHVGIIYREGGRPPRMCHLAWHFRLQDEDLPAGYLWGGSGLDAANKAYMAAYVSLLPQNAAVVPYGIQATEPCFDDAGRYVEQPIGYGLTCATFILNVFARRGLDLLQTDPWPARPDDAVWQRQIIDALEAHGASAEHIKAMREHVGAPRFRPEEVAAGGIAEDTPLTFEEAVALAEEILRDLQPATQ